MKRNTYPVAENAQAVAYREIFKDDTKPGRVKGINNSPNLVSLFPNSPFNPNHSPNANLDRGALLLNLSDVSQNKFVSDKRLSNQVIGEMFANIVDGSNIRNLQGGRINPEGSDVEKIRLPHVRTQAGGDGSPGPHNYNWLYRDQKMDMNFNYLIGDTKSSPDSKSAPVGSNKPIPDNALSDHPFWGHANLNVPSVNWNESRDPHAPIDAQLQRGSGGFGTVYTVSNKAFAAQEKIGKYFTNSYIDASVAGTETAPLDRMNKTTGVSGKSIKDETNIIADNNSNLYKDIDNKI